MSAKNKKFESKNLWAPWRIGYIQGLESAEGCFICHNVERPADDEQNYVLWRTAGSIVMLNKFPYNNGHLLIAPLRHIPDFDQADEAEVLELTDLIGQTKKVLSLSIKPHGFNVGMNFGRCAGAGLPEHLHIHIVPRWDGDTNFMSVCSDTKVISQSLRDLYVQLRRISEEQKLPNL